MTKLTASQTEALQIAAFHARKDPTVFNGTVWVSKCNDRQSYTVNLKTVKSLVKLGYMERLESSYFSPCRITSLGRIVAECGHEPITSVSDWNAGYSALGYSYLEGYAHTSSGYGDPYTDESSCGVSTLVIDGDPDYTAEEPITCPKCHSTDWRCWDERTVDCWSGDVYVGVQVVGYLACNKCGTSFVNLSVDAQIDDPECECEDW